jgi:HEAT repeat protein
VCAEEPTQRGKIGSRKLTHATESRFASTKVRGYVQALRSQKGTLEFAQPPAEFSDVVEVGKDAIPYLMRRLAANDDIAREAAYHALVQITNKRFLSLEDIRDTDADKRTSGLKEYADWWTRNRSKSRVQWLSDDVSSPDFPTARVATIWLGKQSDVTAIPALREALSKDKLKFYAAGSLARLGDKTAVPYLIDLYLVHEVEGYRREGLCLLYRLTKRTFDFDPSASKTARDSSIQRWKEW